MFDLKGAMKKEIPSPKSTPPWLVGATIKEKLVVKLASWDLLASQRRIGPAYEALPALLGRGVVSFPILVSCRAPFSGKASPWNAMSFVYGPKLGKLKEAEFTVRASMRLREMIMTRRDIRLEVLMAMAKN